MKEPEISEYKYLLNINSPEDLRKLDENDLVRVSAELRHFLIDSVTKSGGHFGSGLGVIELTVALHYVFNTPRDKIVFDVGHQAYPHKILTGRRELLHTIRQKNGLCGFPNINESKYDDFGVGHASTSISAALGMAAARDLKGDDYWVTTIIGDGSMTGGMAYEAMNNCGYLDKNILVVFNDNNISISENISSVSKHFNSLFASKQAISLRNDIYNALGKIPKGDRLRHYASKLENSVKAIVTPGVLFEALGFNYIGPINGHNVHKLVSILQNIRELSGPILLHVMTEKGKGYKPAEEHEQHFHAISGKGQMDLIMKNKPKIPTYSTIFGEAALEICQENDKVACITAAMGSGTGLDIVQKEMPDRVFDVGIAEGHAVTFAAGLAADGIIPIAGIYSSFLQRAYDSVIHDVALQKLHVVFALDRAGLVGEDGPTHHGTFDINYLRSIPNMTLMAPKDEQELRNMLYSAVNEYTDGPSAIRYPRGEGVGVKPTTFRTIRKGTWEIIQEPKEKHLAVLAVGRMVSVAQEALSNLDVAIINARFIKPLDEKILRNTLNDYEKIVTIEEGQKMGGFGSAILEFTAENNVHKNIHLLGIEDSFVEHGNTLDLLEDIGLSTEKIKRKILNFL